jgi:BirA family biotin operon repressor/biotin-[acetyl-CoA-carboxylase] ligase
MDIKSLMMLLADGQYHSGEELGISLGGISRTAVWKQLKKLEQLGLELESRKGLGYRIVDGLDLLSEKSILAKLCDDAKTLLKVNVSAVVDSTNTQALEGIRQGVTHAEVYLAEQQTAGRGRRGRQWISPFASNIYMSLVWQFSGGASVLGGLSLVVGVAVCRALQRLGLDTAGLKWPNDIICQGKKLGGILLEMQGDAAGECQVVIGIGLNVSMSQPDSEGINQPWIDLQTIMGDCLPKRSQIVAAMLNELFEILRDYQSKGFGAYRSAWSALDIYADQDIMIMLGEQCILGRSVGVDEGGAIQLLTPQGVKSFNGGEVSLRPAL